VDPVVDFLTSKGGVFAAIAAVLAVAATVQKLVQPWWTSRRERSEAHPSLVLTKPDVSELDPSSRTRIFSFEAVNRGRGTCVMTALRLLVSENGESREARSTETRAPVTVHEHRVRLRPEIREYDLRSRLFGADAPPLTLSEGEAEAFAIKAVSVEPQWYTVQLVANWYDTKRPDEACQAYSDGLTLDFPPSVKEVSGGRRPR
jgi:hypothetical protein